jgi:HK97 gp10 family phage protein
MSMSLQMTGLDEMKARFAAMRADVRKDASRFAVRAAAGVIQHAIEEKAPLLDDKTAESTAQEPGAMKHGIEIRMKAQKDGFIQAEIGPKNQLSHVAYWVEFGHFLVKGGYLSDKRGKLQGHGHRVGEVGEHPFIRPATDESADAAVQAYANSMAEWLKGMVR